MIRAQLQNDKTTEANMHQIATLLSEEYHMEPSLNSAKNILLVDDEPDALKVIEIFLTQSGFTVNSFNDGLDAVDCFVVKQHDLVLTDINMPGLSGIILADYIKSQNSEIPVFAITGNNFVAEGLFDEVIKKPLDMKVLLQLIESYFMADCLHD